MNLAAWRSSKRTLVINGLLALFVGSWFLLHAQQFSTVSSIGTYIYSHWVFLVSFLALSTTYVLSQLEKPYTDPDNRSADLHSTIVVPAYNEDPDALQACLASMLAQSRLPNAIVVVDDGTNKAQYHAVEQDFISSCDKLGINTFWIRKENGGKRQAQAEAFTMMSATDIYVTVDSDSILDDHALEELLKPFADESIQSVAGMVLAKNNRTNLLARITDLLFVTGQMIDRSTMSFLGSVLVNSGGLAAYRASTVQDNLEAYLHETFFDRHIEFSDDSMLTLYSLNKGKTVQQPSAFSFTMMPDKVSHHIRQQVRWMKGSFIRSWWRIKYLPVLSFGFMRQVYGWTQFVSTTVFMILVAIAGRTHIAIMLPYLIIIPLVIAYTQALRYISIKRSDESLASQLLTYVVAPLAILWSYVVLRPIRLYAMMQCFKTEWGTRSDIEVSLHHTVTPTNFLQTIRQKLHTRVYRQQTLYEYVLEYMQATFSTAAERSEYWRHYYSQLEAEQQKELWDSFHEYTSHLSPFTKRAMITIGYKPAVRSATAYSQQ